MKRKEYYDRIKNGTEDEKYYCDCGLSQVHTLAKINVIYGNDEDDDEENAEENAEDDDNIGLHFLGKGLDKLNKKEKTKVIKLLNLSTSNSDGEALNAIRAANDILKKKDIIWDYLIGDNNE